MQSNFKANSKELKSLFFPLVFAEFWGKTNVCEA